MDIYCFYIYIYVNNMSLEYGCCPQLNLHTQKNLPLFHLLCWEGIRHTPTATLALNVHILHNGMLFHLVSHGSIFDDRRKIFFYKNEVFIQWEENLSKRVCSSKPTRLPVRNLANHLIWMIVHLHKKKHEVSYATGSAGFLPSIANWLWQFCHDENWRLPSKQSMKLDWEMDLGNACFVVCLMSWNCIDSPHQPNSLDWLRSFFILLNNNINIICRYAVNPNIHPNLSISFDIRWSNYRDETTKKWGTKPTPMADTSHPPMHFCLGPCFWWRKTSIHTSPNHHQPFYRFKKYFLVN